MTAAQYIWQPIRINWIAKKMFQEFIKMGLEEKWRVRREFWTRHGQNVKYFIWKFIQKNGKQLNFSQLYQLITSRWSSQQRFKVHSRGVETLNNSRQIIDFCGIFFISTGESNQCFLIWILKWRMNRIIKLKKWVESR